MKQNNADVKSPLIDLESDNTETGRKQELNSVQRERLSEENNYCVYWIHTSDHINLYEEGYIGISINFKERMRQHKKNKRKSKLTSAIKKYGWDNLNKQILYKNLTLQEALIIEMQLRPKQNIGWNMQIGGKLGVETSWYNIEENRNNHSKQTSLKTKEGIAKKDTKELRSKRAKVSRDKNKLSYINNNLGSKNPKAILNEKDVIEIKFKYIPNNYSNKDIALIFGVKSYVINFIRINKTWKHVVCDSPAHE